MRGPWRWQFSLRFLLLVITSVCLVLGLPVLTWPWLDRLEMATLIAVFFLSLAIVCGGIVLLVFLRTRNKRGDS